MLLGCASRSGHLVEFLTPNRGSDDCSGRPTTMPALGGATAQPLWFLNFLIHQPITEQQRAGGIWRRRPRSWIPCSSSGERKIWLMPSGRRCWS
ncbi:GSU2403 family nucleotidyltransferase fold protein [Oleomonas cavernae]|uniref:GSU2403 family nucleotidyltransferase fold protein n=1 Tax=Oleomonas cavernae TaxID=2320859 RepID=UPI0018F6883A